MSFSAMEIRSTTKASIEPVENSIFTRTKKALQVRANHGEDNVNFFSCEWHCSQIVRSVRTNSERTYFYLDSLQRLRDCVAKTIRNQGFGLLVASPR
ncbi:hypothetical protein TNIN_58791 [Trichonephila inaurata madagascariensis]|uniref:Uncharacterized protein n=1 Tax=Trichonephila inaurata madagascariensis TaxID=2747483 RepID=A0A8X6MB86_9ARAC|nr:hypothetical protein TNIN_58791 [Trichonephila inaurata madagascariensis]